MNESDIAGTGIGAADITEPDRERVGIETALTALDAALEAGERQAKAALAQVRKLRQAGDLASLGGALAQAPALAERAGRDPARDLRRRRL